MRRCNVPFSPAVISRKVIEEPSYQAFAKNPQLSERDTPTGLTLKRQDAK
jgi:hypothetical protein